MVSFCRFFLIMSIMLSSLYASNNNVFLHPDNNIVDFTFEQYDTEPENFEVSREVPKIEWEVDKIKGAIPRYSVLNTCDTGLYGNIYCNEELTECAQEWDVESGFSVENTNTIVKYSGMITDIDYEESEIQISCSRGAYNPVTGNCIYGGLYQIAFHRDPVPEGYNYWKDRFSSPPTYKNMVNFISGAVAANEPWICGKPVNDKNSKEIVAAFLWYLGRCPEPEGFAYYTEHWDNGGFESFIRGAEPECTSRGACPYTPQLVYTAPANYTNECNLGYLWNTTINLCEKTIQYCPKDYVRTSGIETQNGECVYNYPYNYYDYHCSTALNDQGFSWIISDTGGDCNPDSESDLIDTTGDGNGDSCNSSNPPVNNCKRENYTCIPDENRPCAFVEAEEQWQCSPYACNDNMECGYGTCYGIEINQEEIMPYSFHPIEAKFRSGDICSNSLCNEELEYHDGVETEVIREICEGVVTGGKCIKDGVEVGFKEYYYYTYECPTGVNESGFSWNLTLSNEDPGCVDDTFGGCTNFDRQYGICERSIYRCPNGEGTCSQSTDGNFYCSMTNCVEDKEPCFDNICDYVLNDQISYCEERCPTAEGVYEENGMCKILACPSGTLIVGDKCFEE